MKDKRPVSIERVPFRVLNMECCHIILCWVNPRLMNCCPECGKHVYPACKSWVTDRDDNAQLRWHFDPEAISEGNRA